MRNKFFLSTIVLAVLTVSASANQCSGDSSYRPYNGHRKNSKNVFPDNIATDVKVCVLDRKHYFDYVQMKKAVKYLNRDARDASSYLRFSYSDFNEQSNCDVKITRAYLSSNPKVAANTTSNGVYPRIIRINTKAIGKTIKNQYQMQHIIMHELLHAVGFGHTGQREYKKIYGTVDYNNINQRSIMCKYTDPRLHPTRQLNSLDKKALGILY